MNASQEAVFNSAVGVSASTYHIAISGIAMTLIFLLAGMVVSGCYRMWANGKIEFDSLIWAAIRSSLIVVIYIYILTP